MILQGNLINIIFTFSLQNLPFSRIFKGLSSDVCFYFMKKQFLVFDDYVLYIIKLLKNYSFYFIKRSIYVISKNARFCLQDFMNV